MSVTQIDDSAFDGCSLITVYTNNLYAAEWAERQGITVKTE